MLPTAPCHIPKSNASGRMILASATTFYLSCAALLAGDVERDLFDGAVPVVNYSFEANEDLDFDQQPDDWSRRRGPRFPAYVKAEIDRTRGHLGSQSLAFDVNGGKAALYSPLIDVDSLHALVFQGHIRTQSLKNDAAILSVSFLNHERQRVQRLLSKPVSGTHHDWVRVRIGPIPPPPEVRFVVIGCHLVQSAKRVDIRGKVWFDDLWMGRLPQLSLETNFAAQFKERQQPIRITTQATGLDSGHSYQLSLQLFDSSDNDLITKNFPLEPEEPEVNLAKAGVKHERAPILTNFPAQEYGFYRVEAKLERDGVEIIHKETSLVVMDITKARRRGEFGWTMGGTAARASSIAEIADIASQAGINWLKYPLWDSLDSHDPQLPGRITGQFDQLAQRHVTPIGLLSTPPPAMRRQFASNWNGLSEVFTMPPAFWSPSLDSVIARYSSNVRHWQLGDDNDNSFIGMRNLQSLLTTVKTQFDRIGRDSRLFLHWNWDEPIPPRIEIPHTLLSISAPQPLTDDQLVTHLERSAGSKVPRFVLIKPLAKTGHTSQQRGADLVKRMVAAKTAGADGIFASDVFDSEYGMLNHNGSPRLLFLPWRTAALAMQGAEYLGSLDMPNGSHNFAFIRDNQVTLIVWADKPTTEEIYLGEKIVIVDPWGVKLPVRTSAGTTRQIINVTPIPQVIHGCSEQVTRWRIATRFRKGRVRSEHGDQAESILGLNTFPQGVSGTATLNVPMKPTSWDVSPRSQSLQLASGEAFDLPLILTLPQNTSLGMTRLSIDYNITADRPYKFRVYRPYEVGLGDILVELIDRKTDDGRLEIEQIITNNLNAGETFNFRCTLFIEGHRRQRQFVTKLGNGIDRKFYYLPNAEEMVGVALRLRAEQIGGRRVLNFFHKIDGNWEQRAERTLTPKSTPTPRATR